MALEGLGYVSNQSVKTCSSHIAKSDSLPVAVAWMRAQDYNGCSCYIARPNLTYQRLVQNTREKPQKTEMPLASVHMYSECNQTLELGSPEAPEARSEEAKVEATAALPLGAAANGWTIGLRLP